MSCKDCEQVQKNYYENEVGEVYVRVGNGNVMVWGCTVHVGSLITLLRKGFEATVDGVET